MSPGKIAPKVCIQKVSKEKNRPAKFAKTFMLMSHNANVSLFLGRRPAYLKALNRDFHAPMEVAGRSCGCGGSWVGLVEGRGVV